jgi:hypothetical protein
MLMDFDFAPFLLTTQHCIVPRTHLLLNFLTMMNHQPPFKPHGSPALGKRHCGSSGIEMIASVEKSREDRTAMIDENATGDDVSSIAEKKKTARTTFKKQARPLLPDHNRKTPEADRKMPAAPMAGNKRRLLTEDEGPSAKKQKTSSNPSVVVAMQPTAPTNRMLICFGSNQSGSLGLRSKASILYDRHVPNEQAINAIANNPPLQQRGVLIDATDDGIQGDGEEEEEDDDDDDDSEEYDEDGNYGMVGPGCSDDCSVMSDLTTDTDGGIEGAGHDAGNSGLPSFKFAGFFNDVFHAEMDLRQEAEMERLQAWSNDAFRADFVHRQAAKKERFDAQMKRRRPPLACMQPKPKGGRLPPSINNLYIT